MTRRTKALLAGLGTLFMLCVFCAGLGWWAVSVVGGARTQDPARIRAIAAQIADYSLPPGYEELEAMQLLSSNIVVIAKTSPKGEGMLVMLGRDTAMESLEEARLDEQLQMLARFQGGLLGLALSVERVEKRKVGTKETTLTYRTGEDSFGETYRQMTARFQSRQGTAFVVAQGPQSAWDQEGLYRLLDSIR
ncbi:MAG: hypothetical protein D6796_12175 [Caldilineae bacterium]|nr:MAG: hypothetical protein D6796_12175 [Caldilineae bacterium]